LCRNSIHNIHNTTLADKMRLQSFLPQLLPWFLLAEAVPAQNTLQQTCAGLKNLSTCKFEFSVPYGINVTMKTVPDKKVPISTILTAKGLLIVWL